jgi:hypothetical protein
MSALILLAPNEPRCRPANGCAAKGRCARALADGAPVQDLSSSEGGGTALCAMFLLPLDARRQAGEHFAAQARNRLAEAVERGKAQQLQQRRERMERDDG